MSNPLQQYDRSSVVTGTEGADVLQATSGGNDFLFGRGGNDTLIANSAAAIASSVAATPDPKAATPAAVTPPVSAMTEIPPFTPLAGTPNSDQLAGTDKNDVLLGLAGDDAINGGKGDDVLFGGKGNDTLTGGAGSDTLIGGKGNDRLIWNNGDGSDTVEGGSGDDTLENNGATEGDAFGLKQVDGETVFERTNLKPFTVSSDGVERVDVNGLAGDDTFSVSDLKGSAVAAAHFFGGDGNDVLSSGQTNVVLTAQGNAGNDTLTGGLADDAMSGGEGDDVLSGGQGKDGLEGGAGRDRFVFATGASFAQANPGIDTIKDFNLADDKLDLSKTTFKSLRSAVGEGFSTGSEFAYVNSAAEVNESDALIVAVRGSSGTDLFYNANGAADGLGGGGQFAALEQFNGDLSAQNFTVQAEDAERLAGCLMQQS